MVNTQRWITPWKKQKKSVSPTETKRKDTYKGDVIVRTANIISK